MRPEATSDRNDQPAPLEWESEETLRRIYDELRAVAAAQLSRERSDHTLQATALVNEAFLRLSKSGQDWNNRRYFFAAASEAMRRILVERARRRRAAKRGGGAPHVPLLEECYNLPTEEDRLIQIHEALDALEAEDPLKARIVKLHVFAGFTHAEAAQILEISERSARRHWAVAKAWLYHEITEGS